MSRPRVALLDASHGSDHTLRNFRREVAADLVEFDASGGDLPDGYGFDAAIVTGSRASVYWDEPWIDDLGGWIERAHDRGLPLLGICYGHQAVAAALGGEVAAMDDYEIGYRGIERSADSRLFDGVGEQFTAFTTHSDAVVSLPPGGAVLAENERSIHAFRAGSAFGVQFHPEYDRETAREVTRGKDDQLAEERIEAVLSGITAENYRAACEAKQVFDNFLAVVEERRPVAAD